VFYEHWQERGIRRLPKGILDNQKVGRNTVQETNGSKRTGEMAMTSVNEAASALATTFSGQLLEPGAAGY